MIHVAEGSGGWTIIVTHGGKVTRLECSQYIVKRRGINFYDLDKAMKDARKLDRQKGKAQK